MALSARALVILIGASISIGSVVSGIRWRLQTNRLELETGEIVSVRRSEVGDTFGFFPTVRYQSRDGTSGEFEAQLGSFEPKRWRVGNHVWITMDRGRPELFDLGLRVQTHIALFGMGLLVIVAGLIGEISVA